MNMNFKRLEKISTDIKLAYSIINSQNPRLSEDVKQLLADYNINICFGCNGASGLQNVADSIIITLLKEIDKDYPSIALDYNKYVNYLKVTRHPNPIELLKTLSFRRLGSLQGELQRASYTLRNSGLSLEDINNAISEVKLIGADRKNFILSDFVTLYKEKVALENKVSLVENKEVLEDVLEGNLETENTEEVIKKPVKKKSNKKQS